MINIILVVKNGGMPIIYFLLFAEVWKGLFEGWGIDTGIVETKWFALIIIGLGLLYFAFKKDIADLKVMTIFLFLGIVLFAFLMSIYLTIEGPAEMEDKSRVDYLFPMTD